MKTSKALRDQITEIRHVQARKTIVKRALKGALTTQFFRIHLFQFRIIHNNP